MYVSTASVESLLAQTVQSASLSVHCQEIITYKDNGEICQCMWKCVCVCVLIVSQQSNALQPPSVSLCISLHLSVSVCLCVSPPGLHRALALPAGGLWRILSGFSARLSSNHGRQGATLGQNLHAYSSVFRLTPQRSGDNIIELAGRWRIHSRGISSSPVRSKKGESVKVKRKHYFDDVLTSKNYPLISSYQIEFFFIPMWHGIE